MRLLSFVLLGLLFVTAPVLAAQAADRPAGGRHAAHAATTQRPAAARAARPHSAHPHSAQATRRQAARSHAPRTRAHPQAAVQRSAPMRAQLGEARDQRAASSSTDGCSLRRRGAPCRPSRMSWTRGLPPAAGIQARECPDGTMATLARGHDDIVRCMPI